MHIVCKACYNGNKSKSKTEVLTMNVLLINGSPHKNGCTNAALTEMAKAKLA